MKRTAAERALWVLAASIALGAPALAHHSYAMFDMTKKVDVHGTVKEFRWTNPHSVLVLVSQDAAGAVIPVFIEMNGPGYLVRNGWKRESLKPGDAVTATIHPMLDGSAGGDLIKVLLPDGRELSAEITLNLAPGASLPSASPATPSADPGAQR
jgi:hypothetical protein